MALMPGVMFKVQAAWAVGAASDSTPAARAAVNRLAVFVIILVLHLQAHFLGAAIH
jgi:hypothetical protein